MTAGVIDLGLGHLRLEPDYLGVPFAHSAEYGPAAGSTELRQAVAAWERVPPDHVAITTGASLGLVAALAALDPPYGVLCPRPYYPPYVKVAGLLGLTVHHYGLDAARRWVPDGSSLRFLTSSAVRTLIWNFPHNPTGAVVEPGLFDQVVALAAASGTTVISDDVYRELVYGDERVARVPDGGSSCVVRLRSFSKLFAIPGERVGYVIAAPKLVASVARAHWSLGMSPPATSQRIAAAVLMDGPEARVERVRTALAAKRDIAVAILRQCSRARMHVPPAGIFCWIEVPGWTGSSTELADLCGDRAGVVVAPGSAFGVERPAYIRASFAVPDAELRDGLTRLVELIESLPVPEQVTAL